MDPEVFAKRIAELTAGLLGTQPPRMFKIIRMDINGVQTEETKSIPAITAELIDEMKLMNVMLAGMIDESKKSRAVMKKMLEGQ